MKRDFTINTRIRKPLAEVFNAVVSRTRLARYFVDDSSADLVPGTRVIWRWEEWGEFPVRVEKIVPNQLIELVLDSKDWKKTETDHYDVRVIMEFQALDDDSTLMSISEQGWKTDPAGIKGALDNCGGWTHMSMCLKAFLEHGIDLR